MKGWMTSVAMYMAILGVVVVVILAMSALADVAPGSKTLITVSKAAFWASETCASALISSSLPSSSASLPFSSSTTDTIQSNSIDRAGGNNFCGRNLVAFAT